MICTIFGSAFSVSPHHNIDSATPNWQSATRCIGQASAIADLTPERVLHPHPG